MEIFMKNNLKKNKKFDLKSSWRGVLCLVFSAIFIIFFDIMAWSVGIINSIFSFLILTAVSIAFVGVLIAISFLVRNSKKYK